MATREQIEELLSELQLETIKKALANIKNEEASPQDLRNAITILKDNGFTMRDVVGGPTPREFLEDLNKNMPKLPNINDLGEIIDVDTE